MNGSNTGGACRPICWGVGVIAGIIAFALIKSGLGFFLALILAIVIGALVAYGLITLVCGAEDTSGAAGAASTADMAATSDHGASAGAQSDDAVAAPKAEPAPTTTETAAVETAEPAKPVVEDKPVEAPVDDSATDAAPVEVSKAADIKAKGAAPAADEGTQPKGLDGPRDGQADDLKQIKGVGPALEKLLNELGFFHFDQIAAWSADEVAWVDQNLKGFKGRVTRDNWIAQAKDLAKGS
jgi:NADH-quinone oxidoreductase subunit E